DNLPGERAADGARAGRLGIDRGEQLLHGTRGRRAEGLVEVDGGGEFLAHDLEMVGQVRIPGERFLDPYCVAVIERSRSVPWQQVFYVSTPRRSLFRNQHHGQPRSIPRSLRSSPSFLRA